MSATAKSNPLTDEQMNNLRQDMQDNIDTQIQDAIGVGPKFDSTFVWPTPKPDDTPLGIIKLNVCA